MNILFLTIDRIKDISDRGIYKDLMRKFRDEGHNLFIVTPSERRYHEKTKLIQSNNVTILSIKTLNIQKTNAIEKGISTLLIEYQFLSNIKKYRSSNKFNLILYSTPPITFTRVIKYIKAKDNAKSYLLLKDIFPQNAIDIGMLKKGGLLHQYFRKKEKDLYALSDHIGCMSPANVDFIYKHNPQISPDILEVNPNSIDPIKSFINQQQKLNIRKKYQISLDATVFIYGGNLGLPQGVDFLIKIIEYMNDNKSVFFVIAGDGTEYLRIKSWFNKQQPQNALLLYNLPKYDFDFLVQACDVGMIFLDRRFTIPNFPARILSYMEFKIPVIAATDINTDIGKIIEENSFGLWSESGDLQMLSNNINTLAINLILRKKMGINGYNYLIMNYNVSNSYSIIMKHFHHV